MTGPTRPPLDLSLYLVTDTAMCGPAGVAATVEAAVRGGVTVVQLRDPRATDDELVATGRAVREVLAGSGVPLLVNDRVHLVERIGADGAHVGQGDLDVREARRVLGEHRLLGLSARTPAQVTAAAAHGVGVLDYLGVGPVWATTTKTGHAEPGGVPRVRDAVAVSPWPCVAIGGITAERAARLRGSGAAGVAVVSAVCGTPDPEAAARELRQAWTGVAA